MYSGIQKTLNCLFCDNDLSEFATWIQYEIGFVTCPKCRNKMILSFDESFDDESLEIDSWFFLEKIEK